MSQAGKLQRESRQQPTQLSFPGFAPSRDQWQEDYETALPDDRVVKNRSGILVKPLYTPDDWSGDRYMPDLGFPGQPPFTRGIYPTMHRGRTWTQRQLIGLGTPGDYNLRVLKLLDAGATAISLIPCNSGFRGVDCDDVPIPLLGTCGTVVNTLEDMDAALAGVPLGEISTAMNDYISHFVANHMFYRLSLEGSRRVLVDHIEFCLDQLPGWNPVSVVGQHMQQAGATPAEAMGLTLCTAIQYAEDCLERGMPPDSFLHRFTFFFDISISMFEEIAKFRAGRRIWARIARDRLGAKNPKSWRFKFHAQTSGLDLTAQQPLNNIARVATQAIAGIMSGLQSMHTDAWDEAFSSPSEDAARIAVSTQNILREEAGLCDVIDPLGGSYYVETMTNEMEEEIVSVMKRIEQAGGMFMAVKSGLVQSMLGRSALKFQEKVESGEQTVVGVNAYQAQVQQAIDRIRQSANTPEDNIFAHVVDAAAAGVTHGEIVSSLREELGFGRPLIVD
jgi:methylmalonyl-CoA mutase N-terminal domain/subunit